MKYGLRDVTDWVWPTVEPPTEGFEGYYKRIGNQTLRRIPDWSEAKIEEGADEFLLRTKESSKEEQKRRDRVHNKLQWYFRFASPSTALTAVLTVVGFFAGKKYMGLDSISVGFGAAIGLYIAAQLFGIAIAASLGLKVQALSFRQATAPDLSRSRAHRRYDEAVSNIWLTVERQEATNKSVTQVKVIEAHLRNMKWAGAVFLLFVVVVGCAHLLQ